MKLQEILLALKTKIVPDSSAILNEIFEEDRNVKSNKKSWIIKIAAFSAITIILLGAFLFYTINYFKIDTSNNLSGDTASISPITYVAPTLNNRLGVSCNTELTVLTKGSMSSKQLKEHLAVTPSVPYSIRKKGTNKFIIQFDEPLKENSGYTVSALVDNSTVHRWSIQTETKFTVASTFPSDHAASIPCDASISVTFSESGVNSFQEYFSIYPKVDGTFTHKERVWTFTPKNPLSPFTTYTVTIDSSIFGVDEQTLEEDVVFSFTTDAGTSGRYIYVANKSFDIASTYSTTQAPSVTIGAQGVTTSTADMTVYKLPNAETYLKLHQKYGRDKVLSSAILSDAKESDATIYSQFSVSAIPNPQQKNAYFFNYPKELESGYYLTEILWNELKCYQLLQSHDLATYYSVYNNEFSFWVNNTQTKQPEAKAKITIGESTVRTDANGLALIQANTEDSFVYATIASNNLEPMVLCCKNVVANTEGNYNVFFCTDNSSYQPGDTIKVWGTVSKRYEEIQPPAAALSFSQDLADMSVEITSDGSFSAEIPTDDFKGGELTINLVINDAIASSRKIVITSKNDQEYIVTAKTDKNAYFEGETATFDLHASYFDGLSAANLNLDAKLFKAVTDAEGKATAAVPLNYSSGAVTDSASKCAPTLYNIEINATAANSNLVQKPILVFNTDEYVYGAISKKTSIGCSLDIHTGKIDMQKLNSLSADEFSKICADLTVDDYAGEASSKDVLIEVHDVSYERKQNGTYFDTYSNKIQLKYDYIEKDQVIKTIPAKTTGGTLSLSDLSLPTANGYRYLNLIVKDSKGRECSYIIHVDTPLDHSATALRFECVDEADFNDEILLKASDPTAKLSMKEGRFIYHLNTANDSVPFVTEENNATFTYKKSLGNQFGITGTYFDGLNYFPIQEKVFSRREQSVILNTKIKSEKNTFSIGEKATYLLQLNDRDGKPVKNTPFIFALSAPSNNTISARQVLNQLNHNTIGSPVSALYTDNTAKTDFDSNFNLSSIIFLNGKTDKNGQAEITFDMPESVSQWSISVLAITQSGEVGCSVTTAKTTAELSTDLIGKHEFKPQDDIVFTFTAEGSLFDGTPTLKTAFTIFDGNDSIISKTIDHGACEQQINFGPLPSGEYTIKCATADKVTLEREFEFIVKDSYQQIEHSATLQSPNGTISAILLTDKQNETFSTLLSKLYNNGGMRLDHLLGRAFAGNLFDKSTAISIPEDYTIDGGYACYPDSQTPDLILTAEIASLFPDILDKEATISYFNKILANTDSDYEEVLCAIWGKAALAEAVEKDLAYYYGEGNGLTQEQQLYFALAYAYSGNQAKAYDIYQNRIKTMLQPKDEKLMLFTDDTERSEICNSLLSILATRISAKEAPQILSYVLETDSKSSLNAIESIAYIKEFTPLLNGKNTTTIGISDVGVKTVTFAKCSYAVLKIEAEGKEFAVVDDSTSNTLATLLLSSDTIDMQIQETPKPISVSLPQEVALNSDVTLNVTLSPEQASAGKLFIRLPDGLRLADLKCNAEYFDYKSNDSLSALIISAESSANIYLSIHCKAVLGGKFTFEPIAILGNEHFASNSMNITILSPQIEPVDPVQPLEEQHNDYTASTPIIEETPISPEDANVDQVTA